MRNVPLVAAFAHFFSSCCPDLGCIGLWGHEQAVQQGNHLCCHAVCNVPADERPHRIRPAQETKAIGPFSSKPQKEKKLQLSTRRSTKKEVYEQSDYFLGELQILVERKAECRLRDLPGEL